MTSNCSIDDYGIVCETPEDFKEFQEAVGIFMTGVCTISFMIFVYLIMIGMMLWNPPQRKRRAIEEIAIIAFFLAYVYLGEVICSSTAEAYGKLCMVEIK